MATVFNFIAAAVPRVDLELFWVDKCLSFSKPHLKTGNSETAGIVRWRGHGHHKWTVRDVLFIEPDGHFVVT